MFEHIISDPKINKVGNQLNKPSYLQLYNLISDWFYNLMFKHTQAGNFRLRN